MSSVDAPAKLSLDELNVLAPVGIQGALAACCAAPAWVSSMTAGRPYASADSMCARSDAAVTALTEADLRAALEGHPRIGERAGRSWSRQEQAGVFAADDELRQALAKGNAEYEERFGHIYLVCATGRSGSELLAFLRERLANEPEAEWRIVATELAKINRIRLRKLLGTAGELA
ncbi:MAG TPA: 2-oxo-4-hydroxy-4-carboxy-5-ureidoimidazoline decarboxylase [Streptosporangiaceae bacterium]|nr:2-oxo-4-hydroxy-4-carboxy-5-ureidoimidazoline decarboxylase [Streptosporangiaceae bacterium]